ncbi:coniferyl aldehyde dehydrogenase [Halomonas chromatireducens]|uniref:Aldehyde dehydrogenase n=1 Tax=Halomonas chromatireducens TaxID=507626 RepID=A0A0X8HBA8_9GAMM|nr:coniferyl aldehyde dehydrogenase [Halomonas chromatireducens]AMC99439.1 Coniferyl aldehyde dehydrogenase [Halomonas chromatireducens]
MTSEPAVNLAPLLTAQRAAYRRDGAPSLAERRADLSRLRAALIESRTRLEEAINADFGHRSRHETSIMELGSTISGIDYLHKRLRRMMRPEKRHVAIHLQFGSARVEYQPLGVVGVMAPWNYPLVLALMPLATALAAGNRVMLKLSEFTPTINALLEELLGALFSAEQVAVVNGDAAVGAAFSALPFDHLVFTGSTAVGRKVMQAASKHLVPVTLELGGKSPVIVEKGHPLDHACTGIVFGKLVSGGQTCIAPDYALVHEDDLAGFLTRYEAAVAAAYPDGPASEDYTWVINDRHLARLNGLLEDARTKGATVREIGREAPGANPRAMRPTVVLGVTDDMTIAHEEIFGPILLVFPYRTLDEAIDFVEALPRPLALYYFGHDKAAQRQVLDGTTSGNVTINGTLMHIAQDDLPFGGVGASGIGAYHGIEGFRRLSHAKGIYVQGRCNVATLLRPPFGRMAEWLLRFVLR